MGVCKDNQGIFYLGRAFKWKIKGHFLEKKGNFLWKKAHKTPNPLPLKSQCFWHLKAFYIFPCF